LYSGKHSHGANFRAFHTHAAYHENKKLQKFEKEIEAGPSSLFKTVEPTLNGSLPSSASSAAQKIISPPRVSTKNKWSRSSSSFIAEEIAKSYQAYKDSWAAFLDQQIHCNMPEGRWHTTGAVLLKFLDV